MTPNTVLVIENEETTLSLLEHALKNEGYSIHTASDAETGLSTAKQILPSLILLNLAVPGANGLEICKTIHTDKSLEDVPLVLLTLREGKFDPIYSKLYGIVNFLKKPFTPEQLKETLDEFAPYQAGAAESAPAAAAVSGEEPSFAQAAIEELEEPSYGGGIDEPFEAEASFEGLDEPVEPMTSYGGLDEPEEPSSEDEDDDAFTIDEDVSLEDAQSAFQEQSEFTPDEFPEEGQLDTSFEHETTQESVDELKESLRMPADEEDDFPSFSSDEDADNLDGSVLGSGLEEEASDFGEDRFALEDEDSDLSMPSEEPSPADDMDFEMPQEEPSSTDDMDFEMPQEDVSPSGEASIDDMDFEFPSETGGGTDDIFGDTTDEETVSVMEQRGKGKKQKKEKKKAKKVTSRDNQPKSRRVLVLALILLLVMAGGGFVAYHFFFSQPEVPQVAKAPAKKVPAQEPTAPAPPAKPAPVEKTADVTPPPAVKQTEPVPPPPVAKKTEPSSAPVKATPKPPPPRVVKKTAPAASTANYTVQFGAFGSRKNAQIFVDRLEKKGVTAYIKRKSNASGSSLYYVLLEGGYKTKDSATRKAKSIKQQTGFDTAVHKL